MFVLIQNRHNPKIFEWSIKCVLIGYDPNSKACWCYDCLNKKVYSSYHVHFIKSHHKTIPNSIPQHTLDQEDDLPTIKTITRQVLSTKPDYIEDSNEEDQNMPGIIPEGDQPIQEEARNKPEAVLQLHQSTRAIISTEKAIGRIQEENHINRAVRELKEAAD